MHEEMNAAAAPADNAPQDLPVDRLPAEDDEFRHKLILELPCIYEDADNDGAEKVKWTWHVVDVPESLKATYDASQKSYNDAMDAVADQPKETKIQTVKQNQKLSVKKRGEALNPGLYVKLDDGNEQLLAKVLESGEGKLDDEARQSLKDKYFQDDSDASNDNKKDNNKEQETGLETGGEEPNGIAPP